VIIMLDLHYKKSMLQVSKYL